MVEGIRIIQSHGACHVPIIPSPIVLSTQMTNEDVTPALIFLVNDANILIDLLKIDLLDSFFNWNMIVM